MVRFDHPPRGPSASRFTLGELVLLISCAAMAFALAARGLGLLGLCFLATVISFRTSVVDFSKLGGLSVLLTIAFGTLSIALLVIWSTAW